MMYTVEVQQVGQHSRGYAQPDFYKTPWAYGRTCAHDTQLTRAGSNVALLLS